MKPQIFTDETQMSKVFVLHPCFICGFLLHLAAALGPRLPARHIIMGERSFPVSIVHMAVAVPLHEIRAEFAELEDAADRLAYLVEIGKTLPPLDEHLRTEENRVLGCQARVWLTAQERPG